MSSVEILVPDLPESVADAAVATWHKNQVTVFSVTKFWLRSKQTKLFLKFLQVKQVFWKPLLKKKAQLFYLNSYWVAFV